MSEHPRTAADGPDFSRRRLVVAALIAAVTGCAGPVGRTLRPADDASAWIAALFDTTEGMARFGEAYLAMHPEERDPATLLDALLEPGASLADALRDPAATFDRLDHRVRDEYRTGDVVQVDGWVLARSEARLYALSTLP